MRKEKLLKISRRISKITVAVTFVFLGAAVIYEDHEISKLQEENRCLRYDVDSLEELKTPIDWDEMDDEDDGPDEPDCPWKGEEE